jgi:predicted MFS family arabinose efflux permease
VVFGAISDHFGRRRVLIPMIFLFSVTSFLSGLAHNFGQLLLARALMGVAEGPVWAIVNALVERESSPRTKARNVSFVVSAAALVGLAAAPVLATQIAAHFGWRAAFFVAGVPGLVLGLIAWRFVREPAHHDSNEPHSLALRDLPLLLRSRNVLLCCLAGAGFIGWLTLQNAFGPLFITAVMHKPGTEAGLLLGAAGVGSFIIGWYGPGLIHRFGQRPVLLGFAALSFLLPLALLCQPLYNWPWLLALILGCTQGGQVVTAFVIVLIPTSSVPRRLAASAIGLVTMSGEIFGGVGGPLLASHLIPVYGLGFPLLMASGCMLLVLLAGLLVQLPVAAPVPAAVEA